MGVFSYLKDLLGKEPESSKEDVYVVDPEFEESKAAGDTSQSSSGASTGTESKEDAESDSGENHSKSQESASTAPEGLIKDKGTLAHLLEEEKNRPESSAAPRPRVGEEEIAHSFAAEDLAEDSEDGFEVPESGDSRREDSGSWGGQSEGSADARVESGAEGVNGTPHAAVGDEDVVDTDSDEGVVLRIEDDSDGSAEGEVVVPEGSGSPVVESEGVTDGSGVVEDAGSVVKPAGVTEGLGHVEGPVVKSEDKTAGVEDAAEGGVSSSEDVEVEAPVVEPVDETGGVGDVEPSAVESVGEVSSSEDVEVGAPVGEAEDETSEVGGVESAAAVSADEDSSSEHAEDLVVKPVGETVESERADDLVIKPVGGTVESERVGDPVVKSGDETDSEPVVVEDSEGTSAAEDGMDLVLESDGPRAETADEEGNGSLSLDGGEQAGGLDVFPAYVGLFRRRVRVSCCPRSIPRIREVVPEHKEFAAVSAQHSPHTWGCSGGHTRRNRSAPTFPAYVGLIPSTFLEPWQSGLYSPHTRGCSLGIFCVLRPQLFFPAYAGLFQPQADG